MKKVTVFVLILLIAASCEQRKSAKSVILKIDDNEYTLSTFKRYLKSSTGSKPSDIKPKTQKELLKQMIREKLLYLEAQKSYDTEKLTRDEAVEKLLKEKIDEDLTVSEEEIQEYYQNNIDRFQPKLKIKVRHIQTSDREILEKVKEKLKNEDVSFKKLARKYSESPDRGKAYRYEKGILPPEIEKVIFSLDENEISEIVSTSYGYHIFKLEKTNTTPPGTHRKTRKKIRKKLKEKKRRKAIKRFTKKLKDSYKIVVHFELIEKGKV